MAGSDIAKAYVQIIPSAKGIKGNLSNLLGGEAESAGKSAGGKFSSVFGTVAKIGTAAMGVAASGIAALTKSAVDAFGEYEQLEGGAKLMFGDAYDFIAEKAANAYDTVQMSQNDYLQQVNGFATGLKTALGGNEQAAAELADRIITAEADVVAATGNSQEAVQNAFNGIMKSNFTMLDNLQLGIKPTKEGMQEVIDQVNAWNAANGNATSYMIDNLADCQAALVDYIDMQGLAGYASNEAAGTISGSVASMKAAFSNLITGLADDNADFDVLVSNLADSAVTAAQNILPRISQALQGIGQVIQGLTPVITTALPVLISDLLPSLGSAAASLLLGLADGLITNLPLIFDAAVDIILSLVNGITQQLPTLIAKAPEIIWSIVTGIISALPQLLTAAAQMLGALLQGIGQWVGPLVQQGVEVVRNIGSGIANMFGSMVQRGREILSNIVSGIRGAIGTAVSIGRNVVEGIWRGISGALGWIKGMITGWVGDVLGFLKRLFKIGSPSKLMRDEVGVFLAQGIGVGFEDEMGSVEQSMRDAMPDLRTMAQIDSIPVAMAATLSGGVPNIPGKGESGSKNDLLEEIRGMRKDIRNLKLYLDSGELIGAVNKGLGDRYADSKRRALA